MVVTRQGVGVRGRVWLTLEGSLKTTVVLTDPQTEELGGLLHQATVR